MENFDLHNGRICDLLLDRVHAKLCKMGNKRYMRVVPFFYLKFLFHKQKLGFLNHSLFSTNYTPAVADFAYFNNSPGAGIFFPGSIAAAAKSRFAVSPVHPLLPISDFCFWKHGVSFWLKFKFKNKYTHQFKKTQQQFKNFFKYIFFLEKSSWGLYLNVPMTERDECNSDIRGIRILFQAGNGGTPLWWIGVHSAVVFTLCQHQNCTILILYCYCFSLWGDKPSKRLRIPKKPARFT